ncbi:hypothetical protein DFJ73DRAFT_123140 [Zopfochytrium polystomum]|nr:hypothetical protein DFJ73DRAFT_123140 [Zopfochytrium polystomum]
MMMTMSTIGDFRRHINTRAHYEMRCISSFSLATTNLHSLTRRPSITWTTDEPCRLRIPVVKLRSLFLLQVQVVSSMLNFSLPDLIFTLYSPDAQVLQIETCIVPTNITPRWPLPRLQRLVSNPNIENGWFKETGTSSTWTRDDRQSRFGPVGEKFPVPHVLVFQSTNHSNVLVPTRKT